MNGKELGTDWQLERGDGKGLKLNSRKLNQNQIERGDGKGFGLNPRKLN